MNKFFEQNCLLEQAFFKDETVTVGKYISNVCAEMKLKQFVRFERGEGLQKRAVSYTHLF